MSFGLPTEYKNWFPFIYFMDKDFFISDGYGGAVNDEVLSKTDTAISKRLKKKEVICCPLCGSRSLRFFVSGFDKEIARVDNYNYLECTDCDIISMYPFPSAEDIQNFYDNKYAPHQRANSSSIKRRLRKFCNRYLVKQLFSEGLKGNFLTKKIVSFLSMFCMKNILTPRGKKRLLDVGCGNGSFLYQHKLLGWHTKGIEINKKAAEHALSLGLEIENKSIYELNSDERFDVITLHHVIEHVPDPVSLLMKVRELLAPGGIIYMSLPNVDAIGYKIFKEHWFPLEAPRHLYQYSTKSIQKLVKRSGLSVRNIKTEPQARLLWRSFLYRISLRKSFAEISSTRIRGLRIDLFNKRDKRWILFKKLFKKVLFFPLYISSLFGMGETMYLELENNQ